MYNRTYILRLSYNKVNFLSSTFYSTQAKENLLWKIVNVAIIGAPNSGKSTLVNNIVERKICAASNKVHTTTKLVRAMCIENSTQIVFLDTPGVVTEKEQMKYKLPASMIGAYHKSLNCADVIGVVQDVSNYYSRDSLHHQVTDMLQGVKNIPSFLILNKIDKLKSKRQLLSTIKNLTNGRIAGKPIPGTEKESRNKKIQRGFANFSDVFLVSALNGDGVKEIKDYLIGNAKPASLHYSPTDWTDQTPESLIEDAVRAKFLDFLSQEIPYSLKTQLEYYDDEIEDRIVSSVAVECPSERIAKLISGAGGGRLQQIKSHIRDDLISLFKKQVVIDIQLKVKTKS
ncbi:GTPase Era, mitochondrial [Achroia grisella]|uniref:GTPase Era, mitochondrial n=1 Tax=Achroia grisella TaxID=688607 RepID=UPI0027D23402|nr:GTPase Era, mitochondrial [Achroia grisella]